MLPQELEGALAVDRMRAVEELDLGAVGETELHVAATGRRELMGDPFGESDAIAR